MEKSRFQAKRLEGVVPYSWGLQKNNVEVIKLNTNENPYPVSPQALAVLQEITAEQLSKYPDPTGAELKKAIAEYYDVEETEIFLGNGSDDILSHCFLAFFDVGENVMIPEYTYGLYPILANLYKSICIKSPLKADLSLDIEAYCQNKTAILIANPNAPTGIFVDRKTIITILEANPDQLVIIDEAYIDFASESMVDLIKIYDNVLFIQTLSKSRSLAGLRIGVAIGQQNLISDLHIVRDCINPYNVDAISLLVGAAAFRDKKYVEGTSAVIKATREKTRLNMIALGFNVTPSDANFLLIQHPNYSSIRLYEQLEVAGILVRYFDLGKHGTFLRISIGLPEEMVAVIQQLQVITSNQNVCDTI